MRATSGASRALGCMRHAALSCCSCRSSRAAARAQDVLPVPPLSGARDRPDRHADEAQRARARSQAGRLRGARPARRSSCCWCRRRAGGHRVLRAARRRHLEDRPPRRRRRPAAGGRQERPRACASRSPRRSKARCPTWRRGRSSTARSRRPSAPATSPAASTPAVDQLIARIKGEGLPAPAADAQRSARRRLQWDELAMFFFIGVPIIGAC